MPGKIKQFFSVAMVFGMAIFILAMPARADQVDFTHPAFAPAGGLTSIPVGANDFCKAHKGECTANPHAVAASVLTDKRWEQLVDVNNLVNTAIVPVTDQDYYQVSEYWTYPDGYGDCEDFALAKRKALIDAGWNPSTLLMTVVRQPNGEGHAVLMVRTDRGDLVLDNQDGRILLWNETPYTYLKRQSQADAGQWIDIVDKRATFVASK
ncbi:transglutaminase-like cysteine peptidase [Devosia sp. ZB163]|uniref:transglutaminase-like cysteine peptidase n=1 Tax=Devosia sp. ZB163 TaxID=3025938 RepID=UPI00235FED10|nr:transglutaminase-like cysteine peptidase [Devosia sp. ZB163]MDC9824522.1 transglutaminase-like cysteine peptidase [Devosia sp. ZB163]